MIDINLRDFERLAEYFDRQPQIAEQAARLAVNYAIRRAATASKREMKAQIAFRGNYIGAPTDKNAPLRFVKLATPGDTEAILGARDRATSLARFATNPVSFGRPRTPIRVRVKAGRTRTLKKAFFVRLRRGAALTEDNFNLGLAVRLKPGERIENKRAGGFQVGPGLGILYAPSVKQVFDGVAPGVAEVVTIDLEAEFLRQYRRLSNGR